MKTKLHELDRDSHCIVVCNRNRSILILELDLTHTGRHMIVFFITKTEIRILSYTYLFAIKQTFKRHLIRLLTTFKILNMRTNRFFVNLEQKIFMRINLIGKAKESKSKE